MGADQSNLNDNQYLSDKISSEINDYSKSNIAKDSVRYQLFLMAANIILQNEQFFKNVDIDKIADYINDLGFIDINEAQIIVLQIIKNSTSEEVATFNLKTILPKMRVKFNEKYISPSYSQKLFNKIFSNSYTTKWGTYSPSTIVDWNSTEIEKNYLVQSRDSFQIIQQAMPKISFFIKEKDSKNSPNEQIRYLTFFFFHYEDIGSVIITNYIDKLFEMNKENLQGILPFKKISKPTNWQRNIHLAALNGDELSVMYSLHILPILLNCPDENGNTPAHMAAIGDRANIIKLLFSLGADFTIKNKKGHLPHQVSNGKNAVLTFYSLGFDLNERDSNGENLLENKTRNFNMSVIETLLKLNANIFEPNPNGIYWMQLAIHGEFYTKQKMNFLTFQRKVRKIVSKNLTNKIENIQIIKEILNRNVINCDEEDTIDINNSVTFKDIDRMKILLALGCHPDRVRPDGRTNLMLCAERDDFDFAEILLKNFCDPNFKNERGENTFWVSSYLMNFDTAHALHEYGANIDEQSLSGDTILHVAYNEKKTELFYFLLNIGCSPNIQNKDKETVLFQAFYNKDDEIAETIHKKYKGDINAQTHDGNTLAHVALFEHDYDRILYYIKQGIDIEAKNDQCYSIFMISIIMFDDLKFSSSLLEHFADINTQDLNGNTPLLNILHLKKFDKKKFDFLLNNKCDINKKNSMGESPLSVCIAHELDEPARILLDKGCQINDINSEYEPIANALKIGSKYWFETLINEYGANALNAKFPILSEYIRSEFFDFEFLKKIKGINVMIGAPIHTALMMKYEEVALYLWDVIDEQMRIEVAAIPDLSGMIPLTAAIVYDCPKLVDILLDGDYEAMMPDLQNRTPFSYACQVDEKDWISRIYSKITVENANLVDKNGNSSFTYLACNNNLEYCKRLFIDNVEVFNITPDQNGIITAYQSILKQYNELKAIAFLHFFQTQVYLDHINEVIRNIDHQRETNIMEFGASFISDALNPISLLIDVVGSSANEAILESEYTEAVNKRNEIEIVNNKYKDRFVEIGSLTRKDLFENFKLCVNLAKHDNDFKFAPDILSQNNFDVDAFISSVFSIVKPVEYNGPKYTANVY